MKGLVFILILLSISRLETAEYPTQKLTYFLPVDSAEPRSVYQTIPMKALFLGSGIAFSSISFLSRLGWAACLFTPWSSTVGNEFLLCSRLCGTAARLIFTQIFQSITPMSQYSWCINKNLLSQIPVFSDKDKQLLHFLEKRWLAKNTGHIPFLVDWICPCFGIAVQIHPESVHSYARLLSENLSQTYIKRRETWKGSLPHPFDYPLILTRPFQIQQYLPSCVEISSPEMLPVIIKTSTSRTTLDFAPLFAKIEDQKEWLSKWKNLQSQIAQVCAHHHIDPQKILCIQTIKQEGIGGIRLLPLSSSTKETDLQYQFLLDWISGLGIAANRIELDRWPLLIKQPACDPPISIKLEEKKWWASFFESFDSNWKSDHPQKTLMVKGTMQVIKGLLSNTSDSKWKEISECPTRCTIAQLALIKIKEKLKQLELEEKEMSFFDAASHIELIHADFSSLLEIFSPFSQKDFALIYEKILTSIPSNLKNITSYGIHSSGMTSFAGIFKSVEQAIGKTPLAIFGENTYFECINSAKRISNALSVDEATDEDWKEADLILAQFNPVLKRIDLQIGDYKVERISDYVHKALKNRSQKPLTLALDCTIDYIDSSRVAKLLEEFQKEIEEGSLNIVGFRSGLKFDLFGMDNYCGAPFFMIHNEDPKWQSFESLLTDPALQTDCLSLNWFCLAYQNAAPQLELYRKQIFDNTRALLNKVPSQIFNDRNGYRIIPVNPEADAAFIDIKISTPFHYIKGPVLAAGSIFFGSLECKHPIFHRPSIGFYHPNYTMIFGETNTTIRLTLGLDPAQVDALADSFDIIQRLNGSPWQSFLQKLQQKL